MRFAASFVLAASLVVLAACGGTGGDPLTPPEGWTSNGADAALAAWWHADGDTAVAFRDLSTLETMGVDEGEGLVAQVKRGRLDGAEEAAPDGDRYDANASTETTWVYRRPQPPPKNG
mgnify:CR=1 FL=1